MPLSNRPIATQPLTSFYRKLSQNVSATSSTTPKFLGRVVKSFSVALTTNVARIKQAGKIITTTLSTTTARIKSIAKSFSISLTTTTNKIKRVGQFVFATMLTTTAKQMNLTKTVAIVPTLVTTVIKSATKSFNTTSTTTTIKFKSAQKNVSTTLATTVAIFRGLARHIQIIVGTTTAITIIKHILFIVTISLSTTVTKIKRANKNVLTTLASTVAKTKQATKHFALSTSSFVIVRKRAIKQTFVLSLATLTSFKHRIGKLVHINLSGTIAVSKFMFFNVFTQAVHSFVTTKKAVSKTKIAAVLTGLVTTIRHKTALHTVSINSTTLASFRKRITKSFAITLTSTSIFTHGKHAIKTISASLSTTTHFTKLINKKIKVTLQGTIAKAKHISHMIVITPTSTVIVRAGHLFRVSISAAVSTTADILTAFVSLVSFIKKIFVTDATSRIDTDMEISSIEVDIDQSYALVVVSTPED